MSNFFNKHFFIEYRLLYVPAQSVLDVVSLWNSGLLALQADVLTTGIRTMRGSPLPTGLTSLCPQPATLTKKRTI